MARPTSSASAWSETISSSIPAAAPAARMARACRWGSASRRSAWTGSRSAEPADRLGLKRHCPGLEPGSSRSMCCSHRLLRQTPLLPHHARDTAGTVLRAGQVILEEACGRCAAIARPGIGPGSALRLTRARGRATLAARVGGKLEAAVVAAEAIDPELHRIAARLDDAGTAHAGHAAARGDARGDARFEPADSDRVLGHRVG